MHSTPTSAVRAESQPRRRPRPWSAKPSLRSDAMGLPPGAAAAGTRPESDLLPDLGGRTLEWPLHAFRQLRPQSARAAPGTRGAGPPQAARRSAMEDKRRALDRVTRTERLERRQGSPIGMSLLQLDERNMLGKGRANPAEIKII